VRELSDPTLYIWPADLNRVIAGQTEDIMSFAVAKEAWDTKLGSYKFLLHTDVADDKKVVVRIAYPISAHSAEVKQARDVVDALERELSTDLRLSSASVGGARNASAAAVVVNTVHEVLGSSAKEIPAYGQWVATADWLNAVNWPEFATLALDEAKASFPDGAADAPGVQRLVALVSAGSGDPPVFIDPPHGLAVPVESKRSILADPEVLAASSKLVEKLKAVSSLRFEGLSLSGDLLRAKLDMQGALDAYTQALQIRKTPSLLSRLANVQSISNDKRTSSPPTPASPPPPVSVRNGPSNCASLGVYAETFLLPSDDELAADLTLRGVSIVNSSAGAVQLGDAVVQDAAAHNLSVKLDRCSGTTLERSTDCKLVLQCAESADLGGTGVSIPFSNGSVTVSSKDICRPRSAFPSGKVPRPPSMVCIN
jgi:hypothetical protein